MTRSNDRDETALPLPPHQSSRYVDRRPVRPVGPANGIDHACVVSCDNIVTIPKSALGRQLGYLLPAQEAALTAAIHSAFDLD
jgi:mRNA-degrading endonuclease toxin of MazEF toxin-antitoxin module